MRLALAALALLTFPLAPAPAQEGPTPLEVAVPERTEPVSFALEVSEILFDKCVGCHSSALAENDLNLEDHAGLLRGGKGGPAVVPGKAVESPLFLLAAHRRDPVMPPKDKPEAAPLTAEELGLLQLWIDAGAEDDTAAMAAELEAKDGAVELGSLPPGVQPIVAVDMTADGRLVAAGRANVVTVYEVATGTELARLEGHKDIVQSLRFSPDGTRLAAGGYRVVLVWKAPEGDSGGAWTLERELAPHASRVLALDFSPDGSKLATGGGEPSRSGEVKVWDLATSAVVLDLPELHSDTVFGVRFSPDGTKLATGAADKFVKVVNVADGAVLDSFEGHTHHVMAVDWKSDGTQLISGGADNVLKLWDPATGEQVRTSQPAGKQLTALRWLAGKAEVLGASGDRVVRAWNPDDGRILRTFSGPGDYVFGVAASQDGSTVAAGGADGVLFLWDAQGKVLRSIGPPAPADPAAPADPD